MRTETKSTPLLLRIAASLLLVPCLVLFAACSDKSAEDTMASGAVAKPKEAATQLEQAFATAPPEMKQTATAASEALRSADYEAAVQGMQVIKARPNLTVEQGMAIHSSEQALEARLIAAIEAGDPKAKLAYEQLKKSRRN